MKWESNRGIDGTPGMRAGNLVIGLLLTGVAIAIALLGELSTSIGSLLATLVLGGLGVDALVSAVRRRRSLLSRIGPLP